MDLHVIAAWQHITTILMPQELFDIVDENNVPTGETKPREVVHAELVDWHRATHVWIVNDKREVLCQQRSLTKDKNPGMWQSFFGGHLASGQTYESNALSELNEELGLQANATDLVPLYVKKHEGQKHFGQVYVLRWNGDLSVLRFDDGEVAQVKWMSLAELERLIAEGQFCNSLDQKVMEFLLAQHF